MAILVANLKGRHGKGWKRRREEGKREEEGRRGREGAMNTEGGEKMKKGREGRDVIESKEKRRKKHIDYSRGRDSKHVVYG